MKDEIERPRLLFYCMEHEIELNYALSVRASLCSRSFRRTASWLTVGIAHVRRHSRGCTRRYAGTPQQVAVAVAIALTRASPANSF